ncbi:hypothetical protein Q5P01_004403 [Channa striata]|uniref:Uncharacterized protein n=1 Tax=Channa striata TaxID=64152 RepID=A0AA88T179_CHASR|nr:hypothetical protein Q5P01_004403 [Channa striata]
MADPDSQSPAELLQKKRVSIFIPADSSDPGLDGPGREEEEDEGDRGLTKARPPQLDLRRESMATAHRRLGGQNLRAASHMTSPTMVPPSTAVSAKRMMLLSNEARREMAKQAKAMKEERRAALDNRHKYLISRLVDAGTLGEEEVEDALVSDEKFTLLDDFFAANGSKKLIFFYQNVNNPSSSLASFVDSQKKLFLTTGNSEASGNCFTFSKTLAQFTELE